MLDRYRREFEGFTGPIAVGFQRLGITPNLITVVSLAFAVGAGAAFYASSAERPHLLFLGAVLVSLNAIFDAVDGKLARLTGTSSRRGDYLDHVVDRYSDLAILVGVSLSPWVDLRWGLLAVVGTMLTSYMGTQAQALGLGRNYGGLLGRADRLVLLIGVPLLEWLWAVLDFALPLGFSWLSLLLAYFAIVGNVTAFQRFLAGWRELGEKETPRP